MGVLKFGWAVREREFEAESSKLRRLEKMKNGVGKIKGLFR